MAYQYTARKVLLDSTSTNTSGAYFVGDFRLVTLSFESRASLGASRFTVDGSNADGLQASDLGGATSPAGWSLVTGVNMVGVTPGLVTFDPPGYRWLRAHVTPFSTFSDLASANSHTTLTLNCVSF